MNSKEVQAHMKAQNKFLVTLDEYGIPDTIKKNGKIISAATKDAQRILRSLDKGVIPCGVSIAEHKKNPNQ
jgi:hypothetical protein